MELRASEVSDFLTLRTPNLGTAHLIQIRIRVGRCTLYPCLLIATEHLGHTAGAIVDSHHPAVVAAMEIE